MDAYFIPWRIMAMRAGAKVDEKLTAWFESYTLYVQSAGWAWLTDDFVFVSDRPAEINFNNFSQLHNPVGPAVLYRDGYSLYAVDGVRVPEHFIESPQDITPKEIEEFDNEELRRIAMGIYGFGNYLQAVGGQEVHTDGFGALYQVPQQAHEDLFLVHVVNSTPERDAKGEIVGYNDYYIPIDQNRYDGDAGRYAHAAVASTWRKGDNLEQLYFENWQDYHPDIET